MIADAKRFTDCSTAGLFLAREGVAITLRPTISERLMAMMLCSLSYSAHMRMSHHRSASSTPPEHAQGAITHEACVRDSPS